MDRLWNYASGFITADNIALLSVMITVFIISISRHMELGIRSMRTKKYNYLKLIDLMQKTSALLIHSGVSVCNMKHPASDVS